MTDKVEGPSGSELAARAARLGAQHGRPVARPKDVTEPKHRPQQGKPARSTDPLPSHLAGASLVGITEKQAAVLECLRTLGPLTDYELVEFYRGRVERNGYPKQSESGIRTRRSELTDKGFVVDTTVTRSNHEHGDSTVWGVA